MNGAPSRRRIGSRGYQVRVDAKWCDVPEQTVISDPRLRAGAEFGVPDHGKNLIGPTRD